MSAMPDQPGGAHGSNQPSSTLPWQEIFMRHENLLSSHLEMLDSVKTQLPPDSEGSRTVASMVSKTIQSMNQFKIVRKQMMNKKPAEPPSNPFHTTTKATPTPNPSDVDPIPRPKRSRAENAAGMSTTQLNITHDPDTHDDPRSGKRNRNTIPHEIPTEEPQRSLSPETEDISQEVQRRLRIQEERRRKRESSQTDKRKRESMGSNESVSPGTSRRKKRARVSNGEKAGSWEDGRSGNQNQNQRKRFWDGASGSDAALRAKRSRRIGTRS